MKKYKVKGIEVDSPDTDFPYGIDVAEQLSKLLSEELSKDLDKQILAGLAGFAIEERKYRRKNKINKIFNV
jgi:hypothetical protein